MARREAECRPMPAAGYDLSSSPVDCAPAAASGQHPMGNHAVRYPDPGTYMSAIHAGWPPYMAHVVELTLGLRELSRELIRRPPR